MTNLVQIRTTFAHTEREIQAILRRTRNKYAAYNTLEGAISTFSRSFATIAMLPDLHPMLFGTM